MQNALRCFQFACVAAALGWLLPACDDECNTGESQCVSPSLIRTCIPGDSDNEWLVHQCGPNERCEVRSESGAADASTSGDAAAAESDASVTTRPVASTSGSGAACVGTCEVGEHACVSNALARHCINGGVWQLEACEVGERCDDGSGLCVFSNGPGTVHRCEPKAKACANERVEKVCDDDGTAWIELPCAANEACADNECVPDPKSSCDDANSCLDNKTAVRCLGTDQGFELVKCTGDQYCESGRCRGDVCALGSNCSAANQIRECVDGNSYRDIQCASNEVCQQVKDTAACVPRQCLPGTSACGDPRDPSVDAEKRFTTCIIASSGSGIPEWVGGECAGTATCNPSLVGSANPCSAVCTQGHQRCASDPITGINDGFQECDDKGKWGPVQTCNTGNASEKQCVPAPNPDASALPKALCAEPICWWTFGNPMAGAKGACEAEKLRTCQLDGTLAAAESCKQGVCRAINQTTTADGRTPAACEDTLQCEAGEQLCLNAGSNPTPRFRSCNNGVFGSELETCENDGACFNSRDQAGKRRVVCGAQCAPGSGRCSSNGGLERCGSDGRWGEAQRCDSGRCRALGSNDASCVLECVPGSFSCAGAATTASDGYHQASDSQRTCLPNGMWGDPDPCGEGETCRVSGSGVGLGCIACIGSSVPGGNAEGTVDSRCDPADGSKIQDCGDNDGWEASRTCDDDKSCVPPVVQSCGNCNGAAGGNFPCTETNLQNEAICSPCDVPITGGGMSSIPACTQAAIAAVDQGAVETCSGVSNGGAPGAWAGQSDCCSGYQSTAGEENSASCSSLGYGASGPWGEQPDCCASFRVGTDGASFAYCN